jgi:CO/xanthine dehydrogenase Mo-binding subunit
MFRRVVAHDVGRALEPALVSGRLLAGVAQGFGWALFEKLAYSWMS